MTNEVLQQTAVEALRTMVLARAFENKISAFYRSGLGQISGGVYLGRGQEAFSVALGGQLNKNEGDIFAGLIRDQAGRMGFGESIDDAARTYLGSVKGPMRGRDGNIHRGRPKEGMPAMISHLGTSISTVNGMLMGKRFQGKVGIVGGATAGDGATSTGAFHEGLNQAAVEKLPLVVGVANNQFAYSTSNDRQFACEDLVDRAIGYGVKGYSIDGTDLLESIKTFYEAISRARAGEGPQLVVGRLLRLAGHGEHDDAGYVPDQLRAGELGKDCVVKAKTQLLAEGMLSQPEIDQFEDEAAVAVEAAVERAQAEPKPHPSEDSWHALSARHLIEGML